MNHILIFLFCCLLTNCYFHAVSIVEKKGTLENSASKSKPPREAIPVKTKFGKTQNQTFEMYVLKHLGSNYKTFCIKDNDCIKKDGNVYRRLNRAKLKVNYFTEEFIAKIRQSREIDLNSNSNLKIEINAYPTDYGEEGIWNFWGYLSLAILPIKEYTYGKIEFAVYDNEDNKLLKTFTYKVEHRVYFGLTPMIAGVFLPMFHDMYDHSTNHKTFAIARVVGNEFTRDFLKELENNPELQSRAFLTKSPVYLIQNYQTPNPNHQKFINYFLLRLESKLLAKGLGIVKNDGLVQGTQKIDRIISLERVAIHGDKNIQISIELHCKQTNSQQGEVWGELIRGNSNSDEIESYMDMLLDKAVDRLIQKGEI